MDVCGGSIIKYILVILNSLVAFSSLVLIGFGIYVQISEKPFYEFLSADFVKTPIFFIIIGCMILLISSWGFFGVLYENKCMIYTYITFILIAEVFAGVAFCFIHANFRRSMNETMTNYGNPIHQEITFTWDQVQQNLKCCGTENSSDWGRDVPNSCYANEDANETENIFISGCADMVQEFVTQNIHIIFIAACMIGFLTIVTNIHVCYIGMGNAASNSAWPHMIIVKEKNGKPVVRKEHEVFVNWGNTVKNTPAVTFYPTSKVGICNIVKWAMKVNLKVRANGFRHTWTNLYSSNDQVLISMLPINDDTAATCWPCGSTATYNDLQSIKLVGEVVEGGQKKKLCKIGAATSNEHFREWVINNAYDSVSKTWKPWWTIPLNVIMVEISWGGSTTLACHGAGWKNKTLSDLVRSIEFVNPLGELQVVDDPDQLKAASACFGMLGIIISVTLVLDPLTYAKLNPVKQRVGLAIPPPNDLDIPSGIDMEGITEAQKEEAFKEFVNRCENDYYAEWFWFVTNPDVWVNTWKNDGTSDIRDYPGKDRTDFEDVMEKLENDMNGLSKDLPARFYAKSVADLAMKMIDTPRNITVPLIDALHFFRGIHNFHVYDMEWLIPIPGLPSNPSKPDWSICQDAWWAVLTAFYKRYNDPEAPLPLRLCMEMRIMSGSDILMAPQHGNRHGTCAIEILTPGFVDKKEWHDFMQEITDAWLEYKDVNGAYLRSRPHWAKQWQGLKVRNQDIVEYVTKDVYATEIPLFGKQIEAVAQAGQFKLEDAQKRFSNGLLQILFASIYPETMADI